MVSDLKVGQEFTLTEKTPLAPEYNPDISSQDLSNLKHLDPGVVIEVLRVKVEGSINWYQVRTSNGYAGWISHRTLASQLLGRGQAPFSGLLNISIFP